jgi:ketosteroid isomerase-like protein
MIERMQIRPEWISFVERKAMISPMAAMILGLALSCMTTTHEETMQNDPEAETTLAAVNRFNEAFNKHDVNAVMEAMTDDCVFENTSPFPDGTRLEGQAAVRAYWEKFFQGSPTARFDTEDIYAAGNRCTVRWVYTKTKDGKPWHIRGVDVFRVRDGKVAEKLSYVKG